jgi:hypothetical protein
MAAKNAPEMIAPASPAELTPGAGTGFGPVVGTATDAWVTGAVDPAGPRLVVVGAAAWVMADAAGH